jgi:hypothetical protein
VKRGVVVLLVLGLCFMVTAAGGSAASAAEPEKLRDLSGVFFVSVCRFSHRAPDDPIVFPKRAGMSHDHSFFGNRSTNAFSTVESLVTSPTTCRRQADRAAYWVPTVLMRGRALEPTHARIYYRRRTLQRLEPFPFGLRMIAGDAHATSHQMTHVAKWNCGGGGMGSSTVPTCPGDRAGTALRLRVTFPSCWNGRTLDSADHHSHMAYPSRGHCPSSHPVAVPAISAIFHYPTAGGPEIALTSGGQLTAHADFFNAWQPEGLRTLVDGCLNAVRHCGVGSPQGH